MTQTVKDIRESNKKSKMKRKLLGLCSDCKSLAVEGKSACQYHIDRKNENTKKRYYQDIEKSRKLSLSNVERYRKMYPQRVYASMLKYKFKIKPKDIIALLELQEYSCAICFQPFKVGEIPRVDHDHECCPNRTTCGKCIRGLTHGYCNSAIGIFHDNTFLANSFVEYLKRGKLKDSFVLGEF